MTASTSDHSWIDPHYLEFMDSYNKLCVEYKNRFDELDNSVALNTVRTEYTVGGDLFGGYYSHSRGDLWVGGCNRGSLCSMLPKDRKYRYEHCFDAGNKLVCTAAVYEEPHAPSFRQFHIYQDNWIIIISFATRIRWGAPHIAYISLTDTEGKRVVSFERADFLPDGSFNRVEREDFEYSNEGLLMAIRPAIFHEKSPPRDNEAIIFSRDAEGKLDKYAWILDNNDSGFIYTVKGNNTYPYDGEDKPCPIKD